MQWAAEAMEAATAACSAVEAAEKQQEEIAAATRQDVVEAVQQRAAILALEGASMQQTGPVDDKSSAGPGGTKRSQIARSPHQNTSEPVTHDALLVSPHKRTIV